jgi:GTP-binding protein SAR1
MENVRNLWKHFCCDVNGLIWVYDISDKDRYEESREELQKVLSNEKDYNNIPILIYANKADKNINNNDANDFICGIEEHLNSRPYHIELCNVNDGENYINGLKWLYDHLI